MEQAILDGIQIIRSPYLDIFFTVLTRMGDHAEIWLLLVFIMSRKKERQGTAWLAIVSIFFAFVLVILTLKPLTMRARPFVLSDFKMLVPIPLGSSFPSGHSATSLAVAFLLFRENVNYKYPIMFVAILMAFSRLYVYVHYPSDVVVGVLIGVGIGEFVYRKRAFFISLFNATMVKVGIKKQIT